MKSDEAIFYIKELQKAYASMDKKVAEAVNMAIDALQQVTGKLNKRDDSLLTEDSDACKEQNCKLDLISREDAIALVIKAIHGTDNEEIKEYLFDGLRKQMWSPPSAESTGAMDEAIQEYIKDGYMQPIGEDLISRQDAIRKCCGEKCGCEREDCGYTECCLEVSRLERLPSAPDSRQRGEWVYGIDDETGEKDCYAWTCSVCNKKYPWQPNFCPNCGARMYKGGEEE